MKDGVASLLQAPGYTVLEYDLPAGRYHYESIWSQKVSHREWSLPQMYSLACRID